MWDNFVIFLGDWAVELSGAAALLVIVETFFRPIRKFIGLFSKPKKIVLSDETIEKLSTGQAKDGPKLTTPQFIRLRWELKADLEQELAEAADTEKSQLRARIAELEGQIDDPEPALKEAQTRIGDLEVLLAREGNQLGGEKLDAARAALERGDYAAADDLFAEIEARAAVATQSAARAAFARGEIAEAGVRWSDAAKHYARAAELEPWVQALRKASDFARRSGDFHSALRFSETALERARKGNDMAELVKILKDHASVLIASGRSDEAEPLYRQALEIGEASQGKEHPDYADSLFNLAALLDITDRSDEAKPLYRQAREIAARHQAF